MITKTRHARRQMKDFILLTPRCQVYAAISREVVEKNAHATIPKGNMGHDQYTVLDTLAVALLLLFSFGTRKYTSIATPAILSNFFEELS